MFLETLFRAEGRPKEVLSGAEGQKSHSASKAFLLEQTPPKAG
jgi:hypothetical protein